MTQSFRAMMVSSIFTQKASSNGIPIEKHYSKKLASYRTTYYYSSQPQDWRYRWRCCGLQSKQHDIAEHPWLQALREEERQKINQKL